MSGAEVTQGQEPEPVPADCRGERIIYMQRGQQAPASIAGRSRLRSASNICAFGAAMTYLAAKQANGVIFSSFVPTLLTAEDQLWAPAQRGPGRRGRHTQQLPGHDADWAASLSAGEHRASPKDFRSPSGHGASPEIIPRSASRVPAA
jgi:hypothetical protein